MTSNVTNYLLVVFSIISNINDDSFFFLNHNTIMLYIKSFKSELVDCKVLWV